MVLGFTAAAIAMLISVIPAGIVIARGSLPAAVVGYEFITAVAVMVLVLLAQAFQRPSLFEPGPRAVNVLAVHTPYSVPAGMMEALQVTLLVLVAAGATAVVLIRARVRQVLMLSIYGVLLAVLFLAFQAPDVTLSELAVGAVALPIVLLLALAKVRKREE